MIPSQREVFIHNFLERHGSITVADICSYCDCSQETARRDLRRLEENLLLIRTHGGAVPNKTTPSPRTYTNGFGVLEARTALVDRADVLIVSPEDTIAFHTLVERARRANVPIIAEAISYQGAVTTVSVNNYQAGLEAGRWVVEFAQRHGGGETAVLDITHPMPNTSARSRGFADGLRSLPAAKRTIFQVNGQGLRETARDIAADVLSVHPEINVIFGINDDSALGALDAYRAAGLDESRLLVVSFGLEGMATKTLLKRSGPYMMSIAMFPELVGQACIDAAICAYHGCYLPQRIFTPFAIVTPDTLEQFYQHDPNTGRWLVNWAHAEKLLTANAGYSQLEQCRKSHKTPKRIGCVQIYSSHEWYQNVRRIMEEKSRQRGIILEVIDASHDQEQETKTQKRMIGIAAAALVNEGDTIIVDTGVTTDFLARALRGKQDITVITNSLPVMMTLAQEKGITVVATGGSIRSESHALIGAGAEATFSEMRADKVFVAVTGISLEFGLSNTNIDESHVKQAMVGAGREVIVLADSTKIGVESLLKIAPIEHVQRLITDAGISIHDQMAFTQHGVEVLIADADQISIT